MKNCQIQFFWMRRQDRGNKGHKVCLLKKEDATMVAWTLGMQECGLSTTLHQFKMKVAKFIQTISTPFKDGIIRNN